MDRLRSLASSWSGLSDSARAHLWGRLSPEEQSRLQELLQELVANPAPRRRWSATHRLVFLSVIGVVVLLGALAAESLSRTQGQREVWAVNARKMQEQAEAREQEQLLNPQVRLERATSDATSGTYLSRRADYVTIEGTVTNAGPGAVSFVEIRCALIHRSTQQESDAELGYVVGAEGLPPGSSRAFEMMLLRPDEPWQYLESCRIVGWR